MNNTETKTFKDVFGDHSDEIYEGDLDISSESITSFEGCYKEVHGVFECSDNKITSFEHCPDVQGNFYCSNNQLTSYKGCPDIKKDFYCARNNITSFEYCPDIKGNFYCYFETNLQIDTDESLEGLLSADIQGTIYSRLDLSFYRKQRKIYLNTRNFKNYKLLKGFIEIGN